MNKILFLVTALSASAVLAETKTSVTNAPATAASATTVVCRDDGLERLFDEAGLNFRFVEDPGVYELTFSQDDLAGTVPAKFKMERGQTPNHFTPSLRPIWRRGAWG